MVIQEGKYDSLVTQLSGETLRYWKAGVDSGDPKVQFEKYVVDDAKSLEFDLYMTLQFNDKGQFGVLDGSGANTGKVDSHDPMIVGIFTVDKNDLPQMYRELAFTLRDFLRHEIEHLTQGGQNLRPSKKKNVMRQQRISIGKGTTPRFKYPMLKSEIEPMLQGMYFRAKKERRPFIDVVDDWFNTQGYTRQEKETILKLWNKYIPSLSLPKLVLKEEEEDFNVEAPAEWNVETLTVGDTITPDMFKDNYRFYNFDLYIKEIGWDDEYEHDDIEGSYYVTTEFDDSESEKKYGHNRFTWWLHELNDYLKPEYKVVQPLSESEEEDFSVEAPPEWNVYYLGVGDTIKGKMWDWKKIIDQVNREHRDDFAAINRDIERWKYIYDNGITIQSIETKGDDAWIDFDSNFLNWGPSVWWINKMLSDGFIIEPSLTESEEEDFNVEAPKEWNIEYLSIGDQITPDMWNQESKLIWDLLDTDINKTYKIIDFFEEWDGYEEQEDFDPIFVELEDKAGRISTESLTVLQGALKPEFKITQNKNLTESDDEDFSVEAPREWNQHELKVGDYFNEVDNKVYTRKEDIPILGDSRRFTYEIVYIGPNEGEYYKSGYFDHNIVAFRHINSNNVYSFTVEHFNRTRGPKLNAYIELPDKFTLNEEEDDEFSVEAPPEWNVEQLSVGDTIDKNMWDRKKTMGVIHTDIEFDETYKISKIHTVEDWWDVDDEHWNAVYEVELIDSQGQEVIDYVDNINMWLKPEFKVVKTMMESDDDEFSVEAPAEWNIEYLTVGDTITPDMWQSKQYDLNIQGKTSEITDIGVDDNGPYVVLAHKNPYWSLDYDIDVINDLLKPQYKIEQNLIESDEDFSVEAPPEWNVTELEKGDYIMPDMWVKDIDDFFTGQPNSKYLFKQLTSKPIKITGVMKGDELYFEVSGLHFILTNDFLLPQYKVVGDFGLYESDDEFSVEAPAEWNVTELGVGDYIAPEMIDVPENRRKWDNWHEVFGDPKRAPGWQIIRFFFTSTKGVFVRVGYQGNWSDFKVDKINEYLKPQYKIIPPLNETKLSHLLEMDDEFSVEAPAEWNETEIGIGDYIYPEMINTPKDKRKWNWDHAMLADPKRTDGWKIVGFKQNDGRDLVRLEYNGVGNFFDVDQLNNILKQYRIFFPTNETKLSSLLEMDDEDFNVEAPPEWNIEELGVGDLITPENSTTGNYYLIKRIKGNSVWVRKGTLDYNGEFIPQHSVDFHTGLNNIQSRLKPGFVIRG